MEVGNAVFESDWLEGDVNYRRALLLMMVRAKYPMKLMGLKYTTASLQGLAKVSFFSWIIRRNH